MVVESVDARLAESEEENQGVCFLEREAEDPRENC